MLIIECHWYIEFKINKITCTLKSKICLHLPKDKNMVQRYVMKSRRALKIVNFNGIFVYNI